MLTSNDNAFPVPSTFFANRKDLDLGTIADDCGFLSASDFSRVFKSRFGMSPKRFRISGVKGPKNAGSASRIDIRDGGSGVDTSLFSVSSLHNERLVFITCLGVDMSMNTPQILRAYRRLYQWATWSGMEAKNLEFMGLIYDDPEITPTDKIRYLAALALPKSFGLNTSLPRGMAIDEFPLGGGTVAFTLDRSQSNFAAEYSKRIDCLFREWIPENRMVPDTRPIVECYSAGGDGKILVSVHVPARFV